jgi:hypothetical protein
MTRSETAKILAMLQTEWPSQVVTPGRVALWHAVLGDLPYAAVAWALGEWLRRADCPHFPHPGELRGLVADRVLALPAPEEAWQLVLRRLREVYPGMPAPPWTAPAPVQQAVAALGGIHALQRSEEPHLDRAHFYRVYAIYRQRAVQAADLAALAAGGEFRPVAGALDEV